MKRAAKSPFIRLLSLGLGLELIISPLAHAMDNSTISGIANTMGTLSNAAQGMIQQMGQQKMAQQMAQGLQIYQAQPVPANLVPVPAFSGCKIFMAQTNRPATGQRCEANSFDPTMLPYYSALSDIATVNVATYSVYEIKGNAKSTDGQRCLDDAQTQFKSLLDSRAAEVDKLVEKLNADLMVFEKENEPLLNNIKKGNALLFGTPADLLKDTKFETKFADAQCASMIDATRINELSKGGYEAINNELKKQKDTPNKDGLNAKSFLTQAANIKQDIINVSNQLANKAGSMNHMTLMSDPDSMKGAIKSKYNITGLPGFTEAFERQKQKLAEKNANIMNQVVASMSDDEVKLFQRNLQDPTLDTASIVRNYKNLSDTKCVQEVFSKRFGGVDKFVDLLRDPTVSEKMGREADNKLKNNLPSILNDSTLTIQEKLNRIAGSSGVENTRFKVQRTETINGVSLRAGDFVKVTDLFQGVIVEDCKRLANTNNDKGESPNNIINNINQYHAELKEAYETYPAQLKSDIQDELLTCSSDTSVGAAGTCSSESFSLSSNSFCYKSASTCASNMTACADKAQQIFDTTRNEQLNLAKTYKTKLDATKTKLMTDYMGIKTVLEQKARSLDALFPGQVYGVVTDEKLNLKTDEQALIGDIDPSLMIEDPKAYISQMTENLTKLKEEITKQNEKIIENIDKEKQTIIAQAKAEKQFWESIASSCQGLISQYNQNENQRVSKLNEENQKKAAEIQEFCAETRKMTSCPTEGEVDSLNSSASKIAAYLQPGDSTAISNYRKMARLCGTSSGESSNPWSNTGENFKALNNIKDACKEMGNQPACNEYDKYKNLAQSITLDLLEKELNSCKNKKEEEAQETCSTRVEAKIEKRNKEKVDAETKMKEAEAKVAELWQQYQGVKIAQDMGQQSFPSCGATASGEVGKTAGDAVRGIAGALEENKAVSQQ